MANEKVRLKLKGFDKALVEEGLNMICTAIKEAGGTIKGPVPLPTRINKFTVLRSPHVNKKSREQFEMRTHKRLIDIINPKTEVVEALMKLDLPPGVDVDIKQL